MTQQILRTRLEKGDRSLRIDQAIYHGLKQEMWT